MRRVELSRVELIGFGPFRDRTAVDFGPGVNVLVGPNESGKSTLVAGVIAVLFGLPRNEDPGEFGTRRFRNWEASGAFSGSVTLLIDGVPWKVTRNFEDHGLLLTGGPGGSPEAFFEGTHNPRSTGSAETGRYLEALEGMIGISDPGLFRSTFCVEQPVPEVSEEALRKVVHEMISGPGQVRSDEVLSALFGRYKGITRYTARAGIAPPAKKPVDQRTDGELDIVSRELEEIETRARSTDQDLLKLQALNTRLQEVDGERDDLQARRESLEKTLGAWGELRRVREKDDDLREDEVRIEEVLKRYDGLEKKEQAFAEEIARIFPALQSPADRTIDVESRLAAAAAAVERWGEAGEDPEVLLSVAREKAGYRTNDHVACAEAFDEAGRIRSELSGKFALLEDAGEAIVADLEAYDLNLSKLKSELDGSRSRFAEMDQRRQAHDDERARLEKEFGDLDGIDGKVLDLMERRIEAERGARRVASEIKSLESEVFRGVRRYRSISVVASVAGFMAAAWVVFLKTESIPAGFGAGVLFGLLTAMVVLGIAKMATRGGEKSRRSEMLLVEASNTAAELERIRSELEGGFDLADDEAVGRIKARLQARRNQEERVGLLREMAPSPEALEDARLKEEGARERLDRFNARLGAAVEASKGRPGPWVAAWREKRRRLEALTARVREIRKKCFAVDDEGWEEVSPETLPGLWDEIVVLARITAAPVKTAGELLEWLSGLQPRHWDGWIAETRHFKRLGEIRRGLEAAREAREEILGDYDVDSIVALRKKAKTFGTEALLNAQAVEELKGLHPSLADLGQSPDPVETDRIFKGLKDEADAARARASDLSRERDGLVEETAELGAAGLTSLAGLEDEAALLQERKRALVVERGAIATAYDTIKEAVDEFGTTHREVLSKKISDDLCRLSGVADRGVVLDETLALRLTAAGGRACVPEQLSQGARDQLYLSIRIALARMLAAGIHLPFVFDDPFLAFDAGRLDFLRETLVEMSREHQILILSHREAFLSWGSPVRLVPE